MNEETAAAPLKQSSRRFQVNKMCELEAERKSSVRLGHLSFCVGHLIEDREIRRRVNQPSIPCLNTEVAPQAVSRPGAVQQSRTSLRGDSGVVGPCRDRRKEECVFTRLCKRMKTRFTGNAECESVGKAGFLGASLREAA